MADMRWQDLFRFTLLDQSVAVSIPNMLAALALAFLLGWAISLVYRKIYSGVLYNRLFGGSLIAMTMITNMAIQAVTSSVALTLGMVGALSIVRFRAAIREPMDIAFIFWAIVSGILLGAGMIPLALIGSVLVGAVLLVFCNHQSARKPYLLMVTCSQPRAERAVDEFVRKHVRRAEIKSKTVQEGQIEITYDVLLQGDGEDTLFVTRLSAMEDVTNAVLISHNGDFVR